MIVSVIRSIDHLLDLRTKADDIVDGTNPGAVFASPQFYRAYWSVYGQGLQLFVLAVHEGERVAGIAPLVAEKGAWSARGRLRLEILGAHICDFSYFPGCENPAVLEAILHFLWEWRKRWAVIRFPFVTNDSCLGESAGMTARRLGLYADSFISDVNYWLALKQDRLSDKPAFSPNRTMRSQIRRLKQISDFQLIEHGDPESILQRLPHLMHLHVDRWSDTETPSKFRLAPSRDIYYQLTAEFGGKGTVLFELRWDRRSIAYIYGFKQTGRYLLYTSAIDRTLQQYSPGALMYHLLVNHLAESGRCEVIDYMRGDERYKCTRSNRHAPLWEIRWYSRKSDWLIRRTTMALRRVAKRVLMSVPVLRRSATGVRRVWQSRRKLGSDMKSVRLWSARERIVVHSFRRPVVKSLSPNLRGLQWEGLSEGDWPRLRSFFGKPGDSSAHEVVQKLWLNNWSGTALSVNGNILAFSMYKRRDCEKTDGFGRGQPARPVICMLAPIISPVWSEAKTELSTLIHLAEHLSGFGDDHELVLLTTSKQGITRSIDLNTSVFGPAGRELTCAAWHFDGLAFLSLRF